MILEGIVTTLSGGDAPKDSSTLAVAESAPPAGVLNVAPMGPIVDESMQTLVLRPFQTSTTYRNLKQTGCGVLHVTDDVLMFAQAAIGRLEPPPETFPAQRVAGAVLKSACRWYEFEVVTLDDREERTHIGARVVHSGQLRDFFGFNRAKHAVLEAAILATRLHLLPRDEILAEFARLEAPVHKTAGDREREAFRLLQEYVGGVRSERRPGNENS